MSLIHLLVIMNVPPFLGPWLSLIVFRIDGVLLQNCLEIRFHFNASAHQEFMSSIRVCIQIDVGRFDEFKKLDKVTLYQAEGACIVIRGLRVLAIHYVRPLAIPRVSADDKSSVIPVKWLGVTHPRSCARHNFAYQADLP